MIPARKQPWLDGFLYRYFRSLWRRTFQAVYLGGSRHLDALPEDQSVLAYANHTNWWDLLMVFRLSRVLRRKQFYGMMEEKQLRPYRFFTWIGAFSVDLSSPGRAAAGLRYAIRLLKDPRNLVWMFPQGRLHSPEEPFVALPGIEFLCRHAGRSQVLPCAFGFAFFRDNRPVALILIGEPLPAARASAEELNRRCQGLCDQLREVVRRQDLTGFSCLEKPSLTINKRWEYVLCALRGRLHEFDPHN